MTIQMDEQRWLWAGLGVLTLIRFAVAALTPLAPDEAYYWIWAQDLQAGYLDHPPAIAVAIWLGGLVAGDTGLGVRFLSPVFAVIASLALYRAGNALFPVARPGLTAAAMLNATLVMGIGAVTATPDTALIAFWCVAMACVAEAARSGDGRWWLAAGLAAGCALTAKYTAVFLGAGFLIWLLAAEGQRKWFASLWLWLGGALALAVFAPVLWWNAQNGFASFFKQGGRLGGFDPADAARFFFELLGAQAGLVTPILFVLCVWGAAVSAQTAWRTRDSGHVLLTALILPGAVIFMLQTLSDRVQGNWPAILVPAALISAALLTQSWARRLMMPGALLGLVATLFVYLQASLAPFALPRALDQTLIRTAGWQEFANGADAARAGMNSSALVSSDYSIAAILAFYAPPETVVAATGPRWRYLCLGTARDLASTGAVFAGVSRWRGEPEPVDGFALLGAPVEVVRARNGVIAERYAVRPAAQLFEDEVAVILPRPRR